jgi:hypothetical protein
MVTARMTGGMTLRSVARERMNNPMMMARALRNLGRRIDKVWAVMEH